MGRALGAVVAVLGAVLLAVSLTRPDDPSGRISYLLVTGGAALAAFLGARRSPRRPARAVATLVALGVGASFLGDLAFELISTAHGGVDPDVSVADVGYLVAYVGLAAALLGLLRGGRQRIDLDGYVDIAAVFVVAMLLQWQLILEQVVTDTSVAWPVRLVWATYPTGDAVLLALVVRAAMARRLRGGAALLLAGGSTCWLFSDLLYTFPAAQGSLATWLDAGWMLGAVLLGATTWAMATRSSGVEARVDDEPVGYARLAIAVVPLPLPAVLATVSTIRGDHPDAGVLLGGTVALLAVATLRAVRLVRVSAEARARLVSQERYASALAANSSDAVAVIGPDGTIRNDSVALAGMIGEGDEISGWNLLRFVDPEDAQAAASALGRSLAEPGKPVDLEVRVRALEGDEAPTRWVAARITNLLDDPDVRGLVVNLQDISARKRAEEELTHQAFHDGLTGLANRSLFTNRVAHAVGRAPRTGRASAVIFIDLDGFKAVNDTLGHGTGDLLLQTIADRLRASVREGDTVARLGGDEFAVLVEESHRVLEDTTAVAQRALAAVAQPIFLGGKTVSVTASLGIAISDETSSEASLLRDADLAMYQAKADGKARWVVFDPVMRAAALERIQLESDLLGAIDRDELRLVYQPVVDLDTSRVVGFESLVRWHHPRLGVVSPDRFIPIAEENGLIVSIDRWVLRQATRAAAGWARDFPEGGPLSVSVNISGRHLVHADLTVDVAEALAQSGLEPTRLFVELTETALVDDIDAAAECLAEVRGLGVRVAIDDFGTGYSSLAYLRRLPVDVIKIDRSFIGAMDETEVPTLVRGLLDLGQTLGLTTVAEGVELDSQRDLLRDAHCRYAQGYLFARPMEPRDVELLLLQRGSVPDRSYGAE